MLLYGGGTEINMTGQVGNSRLIQRMNRLKVLNYIRRNPDAARPKIARDTGLSLSSVTNIVTYLISVGLVCENGAEQAERVGRKSIRLRFCADAYGLVCVFLGVDSIDIAYTDLEGRIITRICANAAAMTPKRMVELVREKVAGLVAEFGKEKILAIGVAISGLVLDGSRFVLSASLKWKEFDIKSLLERETELPVFVENMSFVKAVHYFFDVNHTGSDNMLFIDLDGGVGACQYYGGVMNRAMLGEIGHTTVERDGEECFCGNRGCLEAMCSPQRMARLYAEYSGEPQEMAAQALARGNAAAVRAADECAEYLGIGLANMVNLCRPSEIILNIGSFSGLHGVLDRAMNYMYKRAHPALCENLVIREISVSGEDAVRAMAFDLCDRMFDVAYEGDFADGEN